MADRPMASAVPLYGRHSPGAQLRALAEERAATPPLPPQARAVAYVTAHLIPTAGRITSRAGRLAAAARVRLVGGMHHLRGRTGTVVVIVGGLVSLTVGGLLGGFGASTTASLPGVHHISVVAGQGVSAAPAVPTHSSSSGPPVKVAVGATISPGVTAASPAGSASTSSPGVTAPASGAPSSAALGASASPPATVGTTAPPATSGSGSVAVSAPPGTTPVTVPTAPVTAPPAPVTTLTTPVTTPTTPVTPASGLGGLVGGLLGGLLGQPAS
jgi:hypothetical protein